ncbi:hypothetical protein HYV89_03440 [Candidatus Woesearchaeota archaeon]|nr:hypothetical protein [Candidatus Woesearchaeota archaeon]
MSIENLEKDLKECFRVAKKDEKKGNKHKGLLLTIPDDELAEEYIKKAKTELELCDIYKQKELDYKIAEEWFYTLYYCALAILAKFGVESRSQKYTALFLKYIEYKKLIEYNDYFIERIMVYRKKEEKSDVDEREEARYSPAIKIEKINERYDEMAALCKKAIFQCEEIIFSDKEFNVPKELLPR